MDSIVYSALWDGCGSLLVPSINRQGSVIEITQPIDAICGIPIGGGVRYDLGRFPPGDYTVHVVPCQHIFYPPCYPGVPPPDVAFSVTLATGQPVPMFDTFGVALCCVGFALIGMLRARHHANGRSVPII